MGDLLVLQRLLVGVERGRYRLFERRPRVVVRRSRRLASTSDGGRDLVCRAATLLASAVDRIVRSMMAFDRVHARRRAVALARHYRDEEGLSIAEIARQLAGAPATVTAYLYDPSYADKGP